jgi:hypothetical protein
MDSVSSPRAIMGIEAFDEAMEKKCYYVDKTLFIKHILDNDNAKVQLYIRPRRFGKTFMLSMVKCFFEDKRKKEDNLKTQKYFEGLNIMSAGKQYLSCMNSRPVIFISFAALDCVNIKEAQYALKQKISDLYISFAYLSSKIQARPLRENFERLRTGTPADEELALSLYFLSKIIYLTECKKSVILIDEYDVPLQSAFVNNYYPEMLSFKKPLLSTALKSNDFLDFAIVCGCLRIANESIFTGMNNLVSFSVTTPKIDVTLVLLSPKLRGCSKSSNSKISLTK